MGRRGTGRGGTKRRAERDRERGKVMGRDEVGRDVRERRATGRPSLLVLSSFVPFRPSLIRSVPFCPVSSLSSLPFRPSPFVPSLSVPFRLVPPSLFCSVPLYPVSSLSVPFRPFKFHSVPFCPVPLLSVLFHPSLFRSFPLCPVQSLSVPFSSSLSRFVPF